MPDMAEVLGEIQARVDKGLNWLKTVGAQHGFDIGRIDISHIDMMDPSRDPFGQAAGKNYLPTRTRLIELGALPSSLMSSSLWDRDHGFWAQDHEDEVGMVEEYAMLGTAWVRALRKDPQWLPARKEVLRRLNIADGLEEVQLTVLSEFECRIAKIEDTQLGFEDHGILTGVLNVDYGDGTHQGIGGYAISTVAGSYLIGILRACGVGQWEQLKGRTIYVLFDPKGDGHRPLGIAPLPTEPGKLFLFSELTGGKD